MLQEGQAHGMPLPLAAQTLQAFDEAGAGGWGGRDCAYMPAYWASKASS